MATPALTGAALAQNRHQGGLREYVNQKLAPYVKKALKDVCDANAEYPLQWLGEHLINQSLLYENNPDTTGIKERFFYNFDEPQTSSARTPTMAAAAAAASAPDTSVAATAIAVEHDNATTTSTVGAHLPDTTVAAPAEPAQHLYSGDHGNEGQMAGVEEGYDIREQMDMGREHSSDETNTDVPNGIIAAEADEPGTRQVNGDGEGAVDTEMAGAA